LRNFCCGYVWHSASYLWCLWACPSSGKRTWYSSILRLSLTAHTGHGWLQNMGRHADERRKFMTLEAAYAMSGVLLSVINDPVAQASACVFSCRRKTFKHLMWLKSTPMLTFSFLISWTLKANYCVKYVYRFFLFLTFCISQGSVAIRVRCDEKYNKDFAAKLLPSQTVKNFENRTTFGYLTPKARVACFWLIV